MDRPTNQRTYGPIVPHTNKRSGEITKLQTSAPAITSNELESR
ncbi:hypothetical protein [Paenibacillus sp. UMB7766-LJ446]|nr:hypothetical protein [Paenibacillus sp. UMB7766-LJ446]